MAAGDGRADAPVAQVQVGHRAGGRDRAMPNGGSRFQAAFIIVAV